MFVKSFITFHLPYCRMKNTFGISVHFKEYNFAVMFVSTIHSWDAPGIWLAADCF
jgi:hypothetical protein